MCIYHEHDLRLGFPDPDCVHMVPFIDQSEGLIILKVTFRYYMQSLENFDAILC